MAQAVSEGLLVKENYSDKSFAVYGDTKKYKDSLKAMGGKFNKFLKIDGETKVGWIFGKTNQETVMDFVMKSNSGEEVNPLPSNTSHTSGSVSSDLPTVHVPQNVSNYQYVKFKIFKPTEGMKVTLKAEGKTMEGRVLKTETHNDIVDTVYVDFSGNTSLAKICNTTWCIFGYNVPHTLFFSN